MRLDSDSIYDFIHDLELQRDNLADEVERLKNEIDYHECDHSACGFHLAAIERPQ